MHYDFDAIIPRKNTDCVKHDMAGIFGKPSDAIPLWVADMDFQAPPEVTARLKEVVDFAIYGYSCAGGQYFAAVANWFAQNFNFTPKEETLVRTPGVVNALATAVRALSEPGEAVLIQQPVYGPFAAVVENNKRKLAVNELRLANGRYTIDLDDFEGKMREHQPRLFLLCSPHNPLGRVWRREELTAMGDICLKYNCLVVADEIHCDFAHPGHTHHIFSTLSTDFAENSLVCTAPSKTFNLAGLQASNIFIPNKTVRKKFTAEQANSGFHELNTVGLAACQAAYEHGRNWLDALKEYLAGNLNLVRDFLQSELSHIKLIEPEGTYLIWLDFRELGHDPKDLNKFLAEKAKVWLDDGLKFGPSGAGFQRLNLASPRAVIEKALGQLAKALKK